MELMINLDTDVTPTTGWESMTTVEGPDATAPSGTDLRSAIRAAIGGTGLTMQFQPIFQLGNWLVGDRDPVGYEALARFELPIPTTVWFEEAVRMGLGIELELAALRVAVSHLDDIPQGCYLTVNVSPQAVESLPFWNVFSSLSSGRIRIEISEEAVIDDYEQFRTTLLQLQRRGLRVWIDDVGAGLASLKHLILLPHDTIKLDIDVVRGVDRDPNRQAMVTALVALAKASQTNVVAEGIETAAELVTLVDLGVAYGQGYFMGRPAPLGRTSEMI
jgi:EAL domain-containing protein (putative c-di-GMP-specific phosphodiesterase class I)